MIINPHSAKKTLTNLRRHFAENNMTIKERADFLRTDEWINYFNNLCCPKDIMEALEGDIVELYKANKTYELISQKLGVTRHQIQQTVRRHGLPIRTADIKRKLNKQQVFRILDGQESKSSLCDEFKICRRSLDNILAGKAYKEFIEEYNEQKGQS